MTGLSLTSAQITAFDSFCHRRLFLPESYGQRQRSTPTHQFVYLPCSFKPSDRRLSIALGLVTPSYDSFRTLLQAVELRLRRYESYECVGRHEHAKEGVLPASGQPAQCVANGHCFNCYTTCAINPYDCQCANVAAGRATSGGESKQSCFHHCELVIRLLWCCFPFWL